MTHVKFTAQEKKVLMLSSLGGMLEFYDFIIYGIFSVYFAHQFFPTHDSLMAIIESYVVFVLGYLVRPIGGIIFSHIGDEKGRKQVLITTVVLMGISSLGIGLLPTYATIGVSAPILLLVLRLLQGIAIGGELPSTYVYVSESIASQRSSSAFGIVMSGIISGLLLGMIINFIVSHNLTHEQIINFGWRIPFFIGGAICLISYKIRQQLQETKAFKGIANRPAFPILAVFKYHLKPLIIAIITTGTLAFSIVTFVIFIPTYLLKIVKISPSLASTSSLITIIVAAVITVVTGYLIEKLEINLKKSFYVLLLISLVIVTIAFFMLSQNANNILIPMILLGMIVGFFTIVAPDFITKLFPAEVRLTGVALGYNLGFTIFGGLAPILITSIIREGFDKFMVPGICSIIIYIISIIAISFARD